MLSTRNSGAKLMLLADNIVVLPCINKTFNYFYSISPLFAVFLAHTLLFYEFKSAFKTIHSAYKRSCCLKR